MGVPFIPWSHLYDIGVAKIDEQHKGLTVTISNFHEAVKAGHSKEKVFFLLNSLVRYAEEHFKDEEELMAAARFPELAKHKLEHEKLTVTVF